MLSRISLFVFGLLVLFSISCNPDSRYQKIPITDFKGVENWLNRQNDTIYVINFWATWCTPCVKEFPHFEKLALENSSKKVKVLMINMDFPDQFQKRLIPFLKARKSKLDVIMLDDPNQNEWINKVDESWSGSLPATLIYSKANRAFFESELSFEELNNALKKQFVNTNN